MEKFTFFWKSRSPFSQWHLSKFVIDGTRYNCCEQWMMAEKARFFGDDETLKKIMKTNSPREQKALGRAVKNFDEGKWAKKAQEVVYQGNMAKFSQNKILREKLLATKDTTLVEASPYDKVWGIGLEEKDPKAKNRKTWQGQNLLGEILTKVRQTLEKS